MMEWGINIVVGIEGMIEIGYVELYEVGEY